jgi:hypothetical protein
MDAVVDTPKKTLKEFMGLMMQRILLFNGSMECG